MGIVDLLNEMRERLPVVDRASGKSYKETLKDELDEYNNLLEQIDEKELKQYSELTKRRFINFSNEIAKTIIQIIEKYEQGFPSDAFLLLYDLLAKNKFATYVGDILGNYFDFELKNKSCQFYRMRNSKNTINKREELFHIPFQLREIVSTARFSIPGYPCLYLGASLEVCHLEVGKAQPEEKSYACRFENSKLFKNSKPKPLVFLNLTIPSQFDNEFIKKEENSIDVFRFLITYPFFLACLMKVENPDARFKPEYVVPQLLLQYVMKNNHFVGIAYTSTKNKEKVDKRYCNFVIPTKKIAEEGHCEELKQTFHLTDVIEVDPAKFAENEETLVASEAKELA